MSKTDETTEILNERGSRYGAFDANAQLVQDLYTVFLRHGGEYLSSQHRETVHMIFHKLARMTIGDSYYDDNLVDIIGYTQLLLDHVRDQNERNQQNDGSW